MFYVAAANEHWYTDWLQGRL